MVKYTRVDKEHCISCGACGSVASDIYDFDSDGLAEAVYGGDSNRGVTEIPQDLYSDLQDARDSCPTASVKVASVPFIQ